MIREGKFVGWLQPSQQAALQWARMNGVEFHHCLPGEAQGKGSALLATDDEFLPGNGTLLTVPHELILSYERVLEHAMVDRDFRDVLEAIGDFGSTPRGAILVFLLVQASISCPNLGGRSGIYSDLTEYVKSLPMELLPTFWTIEEQKLLVGTTLAPAIAAKLRSLRREYDLVCDAIADTRWYGNVSHTIDFEDWLHVDAMYRSRALDFPGIGHCMVPCIDLANHASGESTVAIYEKDGHGNAILLLRDGKELRAGEEITITYGDEKGACEMLFSYGFLEPERTSAQTLFLSLSFEHDDPDGNSKSQIANCAPGVKIIDADDDEIDWTGDWIWLMCVGFDDGLRFQVARTVVGSDELHAFFKDTKILNGAAQIRTLLSQSELWPVYRLRAVVILQKRIFDQLQVLSSSWDDVAAVQHGESAAVRESVYKQAMQLRKLEFELLEQAYSNLERDKLELAEDNVVKEFLSKTQATPDFEDDFS
ncbi:SET domain-containing protein [Piedraia hortae CBS 480.64]|uniref:SET domain-containing protein n=1 Tax=Piedraia hortae CBS 480.64 TaxID=1314780 RepID=A0A6A7BTZ1_9PEZI|nr:SET domain-containing protein [Piedraia hortae CBS 480.64]